MVEKRNEIKDSRHFTFIWNRWCFPGQNREGPVSYTYTKEAYTKEDRLISLISHDTILTNVKQEKGKFDYIINNDEYSRLTKVEIKLKQFAYSSL